MRKSLWLTLLLGGCLYCPKPQPTSARRDWGFAQLNVETKTNTVIITRGATELFSLDISGVAFTHGDATYDMQYGMFNITDNADPYQSVVSMDALPDALWDAAFEMTAVS